MIKIQVFEWLKYDGGWETFTSDSAPHIIRMKPGKGDGEIIMKTSEGEIHLKPKSEQTAWIHGNTIKYDDSMENKLFGTFG